MNDHIRRLQLLLIKTALVVVGAVGIAALFSPVVALWVAAALGNLLALFALSFAMMAHLKISQLEDQNIELATSLKTMREDSRRSKR